MDEQAAYAAFFRLHYTAILRSAERRLASNEDARDATSETFTIAWRRFDPAQPFQRAWLYKTLWNVVGDMYRRSTLERDLVRHLQEQASSHQATVETTIVVDALDKLSTKDREVLRLTYWEELSAGEIAQVLECSEQAAWKRISRARSAIRLAILRSDGRMLLRPEGVASIERK